MSIVPSPVGVEQLAAIGRLHQEFTERAVPYWLFGGWAVDFHVGRVTRRHDDIDPRGCRTADSDRVDALLLQLGWDVVGGADGYRTYRSGNVQLDVAWVDDDDPAWPAHAFGSDIRELEWLLRPGRRQRRNACGQVPPRSAIRRKTHMMSWRSRRWTTDPAFRCPRSPARGQMAH